MLEDFRWKLNEIDGLGNRMKQMKKVTEASGMHSENRCAPNLGMLGRWSPALAREGC